MADAEKASMPTLPGLTPLWSAIAQFGAIGLMGFMFWQSQTAWFTQVKEDRAMVQRELDRVHQNSDRLWNAIRDNQKSLEDLARSVKDDQSATKDLMVAVKELTIEIRKVAVTPSK